MKCDCECHCGGIPSSDALNDRLYWVEVLTGEYWGGEFAAWRDRPGQHRPWLVSMGGQYLYLFYADDEIRVIHEITPEE